MKWLCKMRHCVCCFKKWRGRPPSASDHAGRELAHPRVDEARVVRAYK